MPQNPILRWLIKYWYYHRLKAYIGPFHPPERGTVCAPTRHTTTHLTKNTPFSPSPLFGGTPSWGWVLCLLGAHTGARTWGAFGPYIACWSPKVSSPNASNSCPHKMCLKICTNWSWLKGFLSYIYFNPSSLPTSMLAKSRVRVESDQSLAFHKTSNSWPQNVTKVWKII